MENEVRYNPVTGEELVRDTRRIEFVYKDEKLAVDMPGWYPRDNDEGIFTKEDRKVYNRAVNRLKALHDRLLLPEEIKAVRKNLCLSQGAAGKIIGGGARAFQKYECGDVLPSKAASNLLRLLSVQPSLLETVMAYS